MIEYIFPIIGVIIVPFGVWLVLSITSMKTHVEVLKSQMEYQVKLVEKLNEKLMDFLIGDK